jgi:hypothetical protein
MAAQAAIHATQLFSACPFPGDVRGAEPNLSGRRIEEVRPFRIHALDQPHLPGTLPLLELRLAADGFFEVAVELVVDSLTP